MNDHFVLRLLAVIITAAPQTPTRIRGRVRSATPVAGFLSGSADAFEAAGADVFAAAGAGE